MSPANWPGSRASTIDLGICQRSATPLNHGPLICAASSIRPPPMSCRLRAALVYDPGQARLDRRVESWAPNQPAAPPVIGRAPLWDGAMPLLDLTSEKLRLPIVVDKIGALILFPDKPAARESA